MLYSAIIRIIKSEPQRGCGITAFVRELRRVMSVFRCYALGERGRIVAGENIEGDSLATVMEHGWQFVKSVPAVHNADGLEIWQGAAKLFSTAPDVFGSNLPTAAQQIHAA